MLSYSSAFGKQGGSCFSCFCFSFLTGTLLSWQLLTVNPEHRFSCLADIQTSAYLSAVVWSDVGEKRVEPGFVPNVSTSSGRLPSPSQGQFAP